MRPSALLCELQRAGVQVRLEDGRLLARAPEGTEPVLLERAQRDRDALHALLAGTLDEAPLSPEQERVWLFETLRPGTLAYVVPAAAWLEGPLDVEQTRARIRSVVRRHPVLRSTFALEDGHPVQRPLGPVPDLEVVDLRSQQVRDREATALRRARAALDQPLRPDRGELWRPLLVRITDERALLTLPCHHLAADAVTIGTLLDGVLDPAAGRSEAPRYASYAVASRSGGGPRPEAVSYWRQRLEDAPAPVTVPQDRPRPAEPSLRGAHVTRQLSIELSGALESTARALGVRPFTVASAALHLLLWRYTGQIDLAVGYPVSTRPAGYAGVPGFFAQTLVQRLRLPLDGTVADTVRALGSDIDEGLAHADVGIEPALRDGTGGGAPGLPFNVLVGMPGPSLAPRHYGPLTATPFLFDHGGSKLDLEFYLCDDGRGLSAVLRYDTGLYDEATAHRMLAHYERSLLAVTAAPDHPLSAFAVSDPAGSDVVSIEGPRTEPPYHLLHDPIVAVAREHPDRVAVVDGEDHLTYGRLLARAEALAADIAASGVAPQSVIGIFTDRSADMVVGLVAILLAGHAYLPLDPELPDARLAFMVAQAGAELVLAAPRYSARARATGSGAVVELAGRRTARAWIEPGRPPASALAYVLFTSGSTGRPKGVLCTHAGIVNRIHWMQRQFRLDAGEAVLQKTPLTFDVSVWEVFWPLWMGARLVLARPGGHRDAAHLAALVRTEGVSVMHFVPSMLRAVLASGEFRDLPSLRTVVCSGEALDPSLVAAFSRHSQAELHNLYGPTEASVDVTQFDCGQPIDGRVPIGRPVDNTRCYILDDRLRPVPRGGLGQLYLAGVQLARGYAGQPRLTAERFLPDPFRPGERMYATGDVARLSGRGEIEFHGRTDHQVKLHGQRIELGEIEAVLSDHDGVVAAAVVVAADPNPHLVGYVQPLGGSLDVAAVRRHLEDRLPAWMVPTRLVAVEEMPKTVSGKIDRTSLAVPPSPDTSPVRDRPVTEAEHAVASALADVLGLDEVDVGRSFTALGGDSISSIVVVARLRRMGLSTTVAEVFRSTSVRELASSLRPDDADVPLPRPFELLAPVDASKARAEGHEDAFPLSAQVAALVMESERADDYLVYTTSIRLRALWDPDALGQASTWVLGRHPFLRSHIALDGFSEPLHIVSHEVATDLETVDLRRLDADEAEARFQAWLEEERRRPFAWDDPPLIRLTAHRFDDDAFTVTLSEPFLDGWSATRTLTDLLSAYRRELEGETHPMGVAPGPSYSAFVAAERAALRSEETHRFWIDGLTDAGWTALPRPSPTADPCLARRSRVDLQLPAGVPARVEEIAARAGVPLKSVCLAVHLTVLGRLAGTTEVLTALMANGRPETEGADGTVGLFLNACILRVETRGATWTELARRVFEAEGALLPHRRYPYSALVGELGSRLSDAILNFTDFRPYGELAGSPALCVEDIVASDQTYFPLTVHCRIDPLRRELRVALEFASGTVGPWQERQVRELYEAAFLRLVEDPDAPLDELALQTKDARSLLSTALRGHRTPTPAPTLDRMLEEVAHQHPEGVALREADRAVSYAALLGMTEPVAAWLQESGARAVGVSLPRSVDSVVCCLAALRAGIPFVPLDPGLPAARLRTLAQQAGLELVVATDPSCWDAGVSVVGSSPLPVGRGGPAAAPQDADGVACILFTSGSSGRPKGVLVPHRAVVNRLCWYWRRFPFAPGEVVVHKGPLSFVDSVIEMFSGLLAGVETVVLRETEGADIGTLLPALSRYGATRLTVVPSLLSALIDPTLPRGGLPASLRRLQVSGEPLTADLARRLHQVAPDVEMVNLYGSTETGADATAYVVPSGETVSGSTVPIGRPVDNMDATVEDALGRPSPIGSVGELVLSGPGVCLGYTDGDRSRFRPGSDPPAFATGDLVRCTPDGQLSYVGRVDRMVKVRGVRVEPSEIEGLLAGHPDVREAWVALRERGDERLLVAHVLPVAGRVVDTDDMASWLAERLPAVMVPDLVLPIDDPPRTITGKVDTSRLPLDVPAARTVRAPATEVERALAEIWQAVLGVPSVDPDRSFASHGGDSLRAFRLSVLVRNRMGVRFGVADVYDHPTLAQQGERVTALRAAAG